MAFIQIPLEIITARNLTAAEKVLAAALLNFRWKESNITYIGNYKLAEFLHTSRPAIIRNLQSLEAKQYIIINPRKNGSASNEILLTFERGIEFALEGAQRASEGYQNDTPQETQNVTPKEYQNITPETQNVTPGYQNVTPHKDINLNNIYLNKFTGEGNQNDTPRVNSKSAPADMTASRSMPTSGSAGSASKAEAEGSQLDIEDLCLWQAFKSEFPQRSPWFQLVRAQHRLIMRGIGKMGDDMLCRAWPEVLSWFSGRGFKIEKAAQNQRFYSEIVIKEAV